MALDQVRRRRVRRAITASVTLAVLTAATGCHQAGPSQAPAVGAAPGEATNEPTSSPAPDPSPTVAPASPTARNPGTRDPGVSVTATPAADGSFTVVERVVLAERADEVVVRVPDVSGLGEEFAHAEPRLAGLRVTAGGDRVALARREVSDQLDVALPQPADRLELRYRLSGLTVRSKPSRNGRALAALGPAVTGMPSTTGVTITVGGRGVLNLYCPQLGPTNRSCATGPSTRLRVNQVLTPQQAGVVVQLDLTEAR